MTPKEKLQKDIEDAKKKLAELEQLEKTSELNNAKNKAIKTLDEYSVDEKIKFFDKMYKSAKEELEHLEKEGWTDEDNDHYAWEAYIEILAKNNKDFWKYWNSLSN